MEHPKYSFRKDATDAVSIFGWETELNRIVLDGIARNPIPNSCHRSMENETTRRWMINRKSGGKKATLHLLKVR